MEMLYSARIELEAMRGEQQGALIAAAAFFGGMLIAYLIDRAVPEAENPHELHSVEELEDDSRHNHRLHRMGLLTALAITIHNFPEGIATFMSGISSIETGAAIAVAVAIHNIPEGMAVGVILASAMAEGSMIPMSAAWALAIGIAIQNFPEGAILSMPLHSEGMGKGKAFAIGALSGIVEPIASILTMLLIGFISPALPYLLAFAAGAMMYVVIEELIPEAQAEPHSNIPTLGFTAGFVLMMVLDYAL